MTAALLRPDAVPRPPSRQRALVVAAALGVGTGLVSSLPSPLPDLRFDDLDILINARTIPLHAGIVFGALIGGLAWLWTNRDPAKCLLTVALVLAGWLAAINTANDVIMGVSPARSCLGPPRAQRRTARRWAGCWAGLLPAASAQASPPSG